MATPAQRTHMLHVMDYLFEHRALMDYPPEDVRTSRDSYTWHLTEQEVHYLFATGGHIEWDCSETWSWILKCAGAWHWSQPGATSTHLVTIRPVYLDAREANVGAGVVFGGGGGHHEAMVHTPDPHNGNPLCFEHGGAGADIRPLREIEAGQTAEGFPGVRLLSIAHL